MKEIYERDLNQSWLIFEDEKGYMEDYQLKMIKANTIGHLLPLLWKGKDEGTQFRYDISGKVSMRSIFERKGLNHAEMQEFIGQLVEVMDEIKNYFLDANHIFLNPSYIFREKEVYYFCYYPMKKKSILQEFHELTEYFVKEVDYMDKEAVYLASELHKASMEENYNIGQILKQLVENPEEDGSLQTEKKFDRYEIEEDICLDDRVGEEDAPGMKVREEYVGWWKRRSFTKRKKKNLWGDWEGLED